MNNTSQSPSETSAPLVSVAIITFNQKLFLAECIESILAQDYPNIEIVVADDCSTDGTQEMLQRYASERPGMFKLALAPANRGITRNSNAALQACSGKYIAWMGGDDLMLPGKLSKQVRYMEQHPSCTICYHDLDVFESSSNKTLYLFSAKAKPREGGVEVLITNQSFNGACASMVRASRSPARGFNELVPFASDWLYWVEALHQGGTINYIDEVLGRYRRHGGNITREHGTVAQNDLDHLNTCNFILALDRRYFPLAMVAYSSRLLNLRKKVGYRQAVAASLRVSPSVKGMICLAAYLLSFGKVRL
jgi:glycosyltransferase involved in cell wall biosynthesis